jgi:hypothetical protein
MVYKTVSVKEVIARVIRNTGRNLPSEYIDDILEWIPEGIKKLKTRYNLKPLTATISISGHVGKLPCGLVAIEAIEYEGCRLREGGDVRDLENIVDNSLLIGDNSFELETTPKDYSEESFPDNSYTEERRGEDLVRSPRDGYANYYKLVPNYIQTSFEEGEITIYGKQFPVDAEGYPLVPDNENYKEALYWYVMTKLIEAGYEHKFFTWQHCWNLFEKVYARRAINEIKYPSVDRVEKMYRAFVRLVPPEHFYDDFRQGSEQIQPIKGI